MVPKKDQHKGLGPGVQLPSQPLHGGQGAGDIGHIVVEHVAGLRRPAGVPRGQEDLLGGGSLIGAVVLIADGEGEPGARFPQSVQNTVHQRLVGAHHGIHRVHQRPGVVLGEPALLKAQVLVDILAVVEPAVAGVVKKGVIALLPEIPDIRVSGLAEVLVLSVAGEKAPLAVHRAAREDIGQQVAGDGLLLQVVERGIDRLDGGLLRQGGEVGQVTEGLQHHPDHVDPAVRRDVLVWIPGEQGGGLLRVVVLRRGGEHVLHAVQKGVEAAPGDKDLHIRPGGDMGVVGGAVIQALVAVEGRIGHRQQGGGGAQAEPAKGAPAYPAG